MNKYKKDIAFIIFVLAMLLIPTITQNIVIGDLLNDIEEIRVEHERILVEVNKEYNYKLSDMQNRLNEKEEVIQVFRNSLKTDKVISLGNYKSTAYDLYEVPKELTEELDAKDGYTLSNKTRRDAMTVAVDNRIIPLGSKLYIEFPDMYKHYNGIYIAHDTGSLVKGKRIDVYMGDLNKDEHIKYTNNYGIQDIKVWLIN